MEETTESASRASKEVPTPGTASSSQAPPQSQMYRPRLPGPCFNCMEMGHLKANCPKLTRPYPLIIEPVNECKTVLVESSVVDNHTSDAYPLDQVRKGNKEGDLLETCSADLADDSEQQNNLQGLGSCEEISELDPDSGRCWELEQGDPQTSDVQGRLHVNVTFWE